MMLLDYLSETRIFLIQAKSLNNLLFNSQLIANIIKFIYTLEDYHNLVNLS
jgi:hypothetical protein